VSEIILDDRGKARGVKYFDANDRLQEQTADLVVVSASATETPRLLLNSTSKLFPNGAGNNHDWVGRNLQGHCYCGANGLMDEDIYEEAGPGACVAFSDFSHGNKGLCGGAMVANEFISLPYAFTNTRPPGSARWGLAHKAHQRQYYKRTIRVMGPVQEMPVFESRVRVDPAVRDHWGIPVVRLSGRRHPHDIEIAKFVVGKVAELLKEAGARDIWTWTPGLGGPSGGQHQAGTCRMGNDPKTSVTNRYGQMHDIDNLFVADGSLHVTNGGFNPALTIMALGYWVGELRACAEGERQARFLPHHPDAPRRHAPQRGADGAHGAGLRRLPRAERVRRGGHERRPHADGRARGHQLFRLPRAALERHARLLRAVPPALHLVRTRRDGHGHHIPLAHEQAQHPRDDLCGVPSERRAQAPGVGGRGGGAGGRSALTADARRGCLSSAWPTLEEGAWSWTIFRLRRKIGLRHNG